MNFIVSIHNVINPSKCRHSRESGNPGRNWIPGQARNDKPDKIYVVMYNSGYSSPALVFVIISIVSGPAEFALGLKSEVWRLKSVFWLWLCRAVPSGGRVRSFSDHLK
jgi:hypothetical protein